MTFAEVGEARLFYTDDGRGDPPMLFVHGYTCDSHDWSWQLAHFVAEHRVIAVDLRGHGRSSVPESGYDCRTFAEDLAVLLGTLGCAPVVAIGHSMGGLVVSALAVEHPELVQAIIAVDPSYLMERESVERFAPLVARLVSEDPVPVVQTLLGAMEAPDTPRFLAVWHRRRIAGMPQRALVDTLRNRSAHDGVSSLRAAGEGYLARRQCPVLAIHADPTRASVETALFADARSRAIAWSGSGHWLHQERPDEFNELAASWLASLSGPS